jgi:hypothetical protein
MTMDSPDTPYQPDLELGDPARSSLPARQQKCSRCRRVRLLDGSLCQECKDYGETYYYAHQDVLQASAVAYALEHREDRQAYSAIYYDDPIHVQQRRDTSRQSMRDLRFQLKLDAISAYGSVCACCGLDIVFFLEIDHVFGGGSAHIKSLRKQGTTLHKFLKQEGYPEGYRLLCSNCNCALGFYRGCPHTGFRFEPSSESSRWGWKLKHEVMEHYGTVCACCGESEIIFLQIDHLKGGGNAERRRLGIQAGKGTYSYLKQHGYPDGYRTLCANCNKARGAYNWCPHQDGKKGKQVKEKDLPAERARVQIRLMISKTTDDYLESHASPTRSKGAVVDELLELYTSVVEPILAIREMVETRLLPPVTVPDASTDPIHVAQNCPESAPVEEPVEAQTYQAWTRSGKPSRWRPWTR